VPDWGDRLVTGRGQSVLRQPWTLFCVACMASLALAAPAFAEPAPDPAPAPPPSPKPESRAPTPPPAPPATTPTQPQPPSVQSAPAQPPASPPPASPPPPAPVSPPPVYQSPVVPQPPPPAPSTARRGRGRTIQPKRVETEKPVRDGSAKNTPSRRVASVTKAAVGSSSPDMTLLIGGLALVLLALGNTVFLALTTRFVRIG
jgi:hypothetical protein